MVTTRLRRLILTCIVVVATAHVLPPRAALNVTRVPVKSSDYDALERHDRRIDELQATIASELDNPWFWGELGDLYNERHRVWNQDGLVEALECFNRGSALVGVPRAGDEDARALQFALSLQKGLVLVRLGRGVEALDAYDTALKHSGDRALDRATALAFKATALSDVAAVSDPAEAVRLLNESVALNPCDLETYWRLALALRATDRVAPPAWYELHTAWDRTLRGYFGPDLDNATTYWDTCRAFLDPDSAFNSTAADAASAAAAGAAAAAAAAAAVVVAAEDVPPPADVLKKQEALLWALYLAGDQAQLPGAWAHLEAAHAWAAVVSHFNLTKSQTALKLATTYFTRANGYWPPPSLGMGVASRVPVFIVGFFRSGSTLLETMLDAHPHVWGMGEDTVMAMELHKMGKEMAAAAAAWESAAPTSAAAAAAAAAAAGGGAAGGAATPVVVGAARRRRLVVDDSDAYENPYVAIVNRRAENILKRMEERAQDLLSHDDAGDAERGGPTGDAGFTHIVDKMLSNYKNLAFIHLLFPHAVVLHTVRDPMDTLYSCYKNRFNDDDVAFAHNVTELVAEYVIYLELMAHFRRELPPGRIIDVSYEALVASPEAVLRHVVSDAANGLRLPWDPVVLRHHERPRNVRTASMLQVRRSVYTSSVGGWTRRADDLRPIADELRRHVPHLQAVGALEPVTLPPPASTEGPVGSTQGCGVSRVAMNWNASEGFDYPQMLATIARAFNGTACRATDDGAAASATDTSTANATVIPPKPPPPPRKEVLYTSVEEGMVEVLYALHDANRLAAGATIGPLHEAFLAVEARLREAPEPFLVRPIQDPSEQPTPRNGGGDGGEGQCDAVDLRQLSLLVERISLEATRARLLVALARPTDAARGAARAIRWFRQVAATAASCAGVEGGAAQERVAQVGARLLALRADALRYAQRGARCPPLQPDPTRSAALIDGGSGAGETWDTVDTREPADGAADADAAEDGDCGNHALEAARLLRRALRLEPNELQLYQHLVVALQESGTMVGPDRAVRWMHLVHEMDAAVTRLIAEALAHGPTPTAPGGADTAGATSRWWQPARVSAPRRGLPRNGRAVPTAAAAGSGDSAKAAAPTLVDALLRRNVGVYWGLFYACDYASDSDDPATTSGSSSGGGDNGCSRDRAWRYLQTAKDIDGHRLQGPSSPYNLTDSVWRSRSIRASYTRASGFWPVDPRKGRPAVGSSSRVPVFIVGFLRSGSTLLETMLDAHPHVWGMGEDTVFPQAVGSLNDELVALLDMGAANARLPPGKRDPKLTPDWARTRLKAIVDAHASAVLEGVRKRRKIHEVHFNVSVDEDGATRSARDDDENEEDEDEGPDGPGNKEAARRPAIKRAVDKMLGNYKNLAFIHLLFPHAVVLHTVRDPMDTLYSCHTKRFASDSAAWAGDAVTLITEYAIYLELMAHFRRELPPGRIIDVSYEALVASPEAVLRHVVSDAANGLRLPWDPAVLSYKDSRRPVKTASVLQVREPLNKRSIGGWRRYAAQLAPFRRYLEQFIPHLNATGAWPQAYQWEPVA